MPGAADDPIRIVSWRLAATGDADPDLLLRAAGVARHDHDFATTARLAEASLAARPTAEAGLLLGEALHNLCSFGEADAVLADAAERAADEEVGGRLATMRRRNLFFGVGRLDLAADAGSADVSAFDLRPSRVAGRRGGDPHGESVARSRRSPSSSEWTSTRRAPTSSPRSREPPPWR